MSFASVMESISFQANGHEPNVKAASAEPHGERVRVGAPASSSSTVIVTHSLLSPAIIEALLSGQQQTDLELADLLKPFPIEWDKQEAFFNSRAI